MNPFAGPATCGPAEDGGRRPIGQRALDCLPAAHRSDKDTLLQTVLFPGDGREQRVAIASPGRDPLTYAALAERVLDAAGRLRALGIGPDDRVALVLPNGPEAAVAFLSVAVCAACAPLNPTYRASEFHFYLSDLAPRALLCWADADTPAAEVAGALGVRVLRLRPEARRPAGWFTLLGADRSDGPPDSPRPEQIALLLHTSGTTSRPKMVPLTHRNLCASMQNIGATLRLTPEDRCLNVMPLFHVHGLVGAVLASLAAGASVSCTAGFDAPRFLDWLNGERATWYSAAPTIHQGVLSRARMAPGRAAGARLRVIRSASSALPPSVMAGLEEAFGAPVIEAYGMTEAANQLASNPLPPLPRKPGSVGLPAGPEVAVMEEGGATLLPPGGVGEVVARGPCIMSGYLNAPEANARAFTDGWFRTGDQGYFDADGYLHLTGRLKELINRGGEKISPREVDEALLEHPAVAQAVAFALPDPRLGEEVAAAVVLHHPAGAGGAPALSEGDLQRFVAQRLADFKVPRRIVILDELPKGPTGKVQRIGLAARLGLVAEIPQASAPRASGGRAPATETERWVAALWCELLGLQGVAADVPWLEAGGDSLLATRLLARVRRDFSVSVSIVDFFEAPTVADQAALIECRRAAEGAAAHGPAAHRAPEKR